METIFKFLQSALHIQNGKYVNTYHILSFFLPQRITNNYRQKQPSGGVLRKRCSENMQQIYRRTPTAKPDFDKVAWQPILIKLKTLNDWGNLCNQNNQNTTTNSYIIHVWDEPPYQYQHYQKFWRSKNCFKFSFWLVKPVPLKWLLSFTTLFANYFEHIRIF